MTDHSPRRLYAQMCPGMQIDLVTGSGGARTRYRHRYSQEEGKKTIDFNVYRIKYTNRAKKSAVHHRAKNPMK